MLTHQSTLTVSGWSGAGYVIYDPVTGDGAYRISGGANGAFYALIGGLLLVVLGLTLFYGGGLIALVGMGIAALGATTSTIALLSDLELFFAFFDNFTYLLSAFAVVGVLAHFGILGVFLATVFTATTAAAIFTIILDIFGIYYTVGRNN